MTVAFLKFCSSEAFSKGKTRTHPLVVTRLWLWTGSRRMTFQPSRGSSPTLSFQMCGSSLDETEPRVHFRVQRLMRTLHRDGSSRFRHHHPRRLHDRSARSRTAAAALCHEMQRGP